MNITGFDLDAKSFKSLSKMAAFTIEQYCAAYETFYMEYGPWNMTCQLNVINIYTFKNINWYM